MTKAEFKRAMQCGLGRCVSELYESDSADRYKQLVLWGCLHGLSFDTQCEGTRADYVYEMLKTYKDDSFFLAPVIEKFEKMSGENYREFSHLIELVSCFAFDGNEEAKAALYKKYDRLFAVLIKRRSVSGYDFERDNYETVCINLTSLDGFSAYQKIAFDMGKLFLSNRYYSDYRFDWFYSNSSNKFGKRKIKAFLKRGTENNKELCAFNQSLLETEQFFSKQSDSDLNVLTAEEAVETAGKGLITIRDKILFKRRADFSQKVKLAQAALKETDIDKKTELLSFFSGQEFPLECEELIEYAKSDNVKLSAAAFDILSSSKGAAVYDFAHELIKEKNQSFYALVILINNYKKSDKALILSALGSIPTAHGNESDWHGIIHAILDAYDVHVRLPKEFLYYIYNNSLCSCCREYAVRRIAKRKWLTKEIIEECRFDSNYDIRKYVYRYYR